MSLLAFQTYPPEATRTNCGCQTCGCKNDLPAHVGRSPYSLHHADASRFKAVGELDLLEDHLINDPCPDCMNKHAMTASRFMSEAASLNGGEPGDVVGSDLIESARQCIKPESDIELARRVRDIRKVIQKKLKLSHAHGQSDTHAHAHAPDGSEIATNDHAPANTNETPAATDAADATSTNPVNTNADGPGAHVHDDPLREPLVAGRYGLASVGGLLVPNAQAARVGVADNTGIVNPFYPIAAVVGALVGYRFGGFLFALPGAVAAVVAGMLPVYQNRSTGMIVGDWYVNKSGFYKP